MLRILSVLFLAFLLSFSASSQSNPPPSPTVNLRAEQLQQQINQLQMEVKAAQNNPADHDNLVTLTKGLPDLEKRVEDIHQYVAYWGWFSGGAFAVITLLFVYVSFRTLALAKNEAKKAIKKLVSNKVEQVTRAIDEKGQEIFKAIAEQANQHHQQLTVLEDKSETLLNRLSSQSHGSDEKERILNEKDVDELHRITEQLRQKSKDQYTFADWRALYIESSSREAWSEAGNYVDEMECIAADDWENATTKTARAWILREGQHYTEAIKLLDEIVDGYVESDDHRLMERVANAQLMKSGIHIDQVQWDEAIAVCDEIVSHYAPNNETAIAAVVAKALYMKGLILEQQNLPEAAIAIYDEAVSRYGKCSETDIVENVAWMLLSKGWILEKQDQQKDSIVIYSDLVTRYGTRSEPEIVFPIARALFSRAIALQNSQRTFEAKVAYASFIEHYASRSESVILELVEKAIKSINE